MGLKADLLDAITSAYVDTNSQADSLDLPDISDAVSYTHLPLPTIYSE